MNKREKQDGVGSFLSVFPWEFFTKYTRQQLLSIGSFILIVICTSAIILWALITEATTRPPLLIAAKTSAFLAIILLSMNFLLATRLKVLERAFGGLDKLYKVHKLVGKLALLFALLHPIFLAVHRANQPHLLMMYFLPGVNVPYTLGLLATSGLLVVVFLSVRPTLPYHLWKKTHRFIVLPLFLAAVHALLSGSDISRHPALGYLVLTFSFIGLLSFLYIVLLYRYFGPRTQGTVTKVRKMGNITELTIAPDKALRFHPGQFIFIRFLAFPNSKESFPFSLSSDPSESELRISVKAAGDFTSGPLTESAPGHRVEIMGPYGKFGERYLAQRRDMIWLAGGIGITPFLSMAKHERRQPPKRRVDLVWVYSDPSDMAYEEEILKEMKGRQSFHYHHWNSRTMGRIDAVKLASLVGGVEELRRRAIFVCGPPALMRSMFDQLVRLGVTPRNIIYEDFNLLG
ncbi:MAG: ferric reductase-like transmembrane domain-containing protein [Methanomassiliicoccales archaeon]